MVLEKLVSIKEAVRKPWWMFLVGGIIATVCVFISFIIFPKSTGMFATFLMTFAITPFMVNLITYEEAREEEQIKSKMQMNFLARHRSTLTIYASFFSGMIIFLSVLFLVLPQPVSEQMFSDQLSELKLIRGNAIISDNFQKILLNNFGVLSMSFMFSLLFGAGAVFILSWNATVLSSAIAEVARNITGAHGILAISAIPAGVLTFLPHGSLEILAYFIGGIAGGILSAAIVRRSSSMFRPMFFDSLVLFAVAAAILVPAALIEVYLISLA